jgi:hypothetical protein
MSRADTLDEFRNAWTYALQQKSLKAVKVSYAKQLEQAYEQRSSYYDAMLDNAKWMKDKLGEPDDYGVDLDFMAGFQQLSERYFTEVEHLEKNLDYVTPHQLQGLLYDDNDERNMISPAAQFLLTHPNDPIGCPGGDCVVVIVVRSWEG